jgi:23S rRNA (uracil1939-C5)-methyltransferase
MMSLETEGLLKTTTALTILDYSKKGHGLAKLEKDSGVSPIDVEIPGAVIGERVEVLVGRKKKRFYQGKLLKLLSSSHDRVEPSCQHAGVCGGCSWQHLDYTAELSYKQNTVASLFSSYLTTAHLHPIIGSEQTWHYRNKMEFSFSQDQSGEKYLGLIKGGSRGRVLNLAQCELTSSWVITVLSHVKAWWENSSLLAFHPPSGKGTLRTLTVREGKNTGEKMVILTVSGTHESFLKRSHLTQFQQAVLKALPDDHPSIFLRIHQAEKGRPTTFYEMHLSGPSLLHETLEIQGRALNFHISPSSFFQPNTQQAEKLYTRALEIAAPTSSMRVYDLYAGCGALGMVFSPYVKKVLSIELCSYAVCDGEINIENNHLLNMKMIRGDVGHILEEIQLPADLAIVDPPRSGLDSSALKHLFRLAPQKILYISCNPTTQAENLKELTQQGYTLKEIQLVDQFPHTPHIENICLLTRF